MVLIKNGDKRILTDEEMIKMFLEAGWTEEKPKPKFNKANKEEDK
nr:MAG TPA: hypothetical protein [Bacteriophage sp.]